MGILAQVHCGKKNPLHKFAFDDEVTMTQESDGEDCYP